MLVRNGMLVVWVFTSHNKKIMEYMISIYPLSEIVDNASKDMT